VEAICWDRALVLWKKNLPGRGLTKVEKHCRGRNLLGPGPRLVKKEFTWPRSHKGWETLSWRQSVGTGTSSYEKRIYRAAVSQRLRDTVVEAICWDRDLVLWKKNLPGRGLTKVEGHCRRGNLLGPGPRLMKKEFTGPCSHKVWETLIWKERKKHANSGEAHTAVTVKRLSHLISLCYGIWTTHSFQYQCNMIHPSMSVSSNYSLLSNFS